MVADVNLVLSCGMCFLPQHYGQMPQRGGRCGTQASGIYPSQTLSGTLQVHDNCRPSHLIRGKLLFKRRLLVDLPMGRDKMLGLESL